MAGNVTELDSLWWCLVLLLLILRCLENSVFQPRPRHFCFQNKQKLTILMNLCYLSVSHGWKCHTTGFPTMMFDSFALNSTFSWKFCVPAPPWTFFVFKTNFHFKSSNYNHNRDCVSYQSYYEFYFFLSSSLWANKIIIWVHFWSVVLYFYQ